MTPARAPGQRWPEYLIEAWALGTFMLSLAIFAVLIFDPRLPIGAMSIPPIARRFLMGLAMASTAIALIYSPWGRRSGPHMNPATTLTFWRLRKIESPDAVAYVISQFAGGALGLLIGTVLTCSFIGPPVPTGVTHPGMFGIVLAWFGELAISFLLMSVVLRVSNHPATNRFTGLCAGALVLTFITLEDPISGMSMNPARSFASALIAHNWQHLWIYFTAPPAGMLLAAELFVRTRGLGAVLCAKLCHDSPHPCIFRCSFCSHAASEPAQAP